MVTLETILVGGTSSQMLIGNICSIKSSWISSDDGILAIGSNGNRLIDNSSELIEGLNQGEGFAKLGSFDSNGDSLIDASDTDFAGLII